MSKRKTKNVIAPVGSPAWWMNCATAHLAAIATRHKALTCELIRDTAYGMGLSKAFDDHAWGAVMRRAKKLGIIEPTSTLVPSRNPAHHAGNSRVWRSLVHGTNVLHAAYLASGKAMVH